MQIIGSITLALVPAYIWGYIYYKKQPEDKKLVAMTFIAGAIAVFPILIYKALWEFFPSINAFHLASFYNEDIIGITTLVKLPLSLLITFVFVGILEELMKFFSIKVVDDDKNLRCVDDSIEFFVIAALGFAFTENILYFYNIWLTEGVSNLFMPFLFRSSFSTFAHIMFSGVLGFYYGEAHFAKTVLQQEIRDGRGKWMLRLHKILGWHKEKMFHEERMLEGLLLAVGLHAIFNVLLEMNIGFMIVPFLFSGYLALEYLFDKKENHKKYGKVLVGERNH